MAKLADGDTVGLQGEVTLTNKERYTTTERGDGRRSFLTLLASKVRRDGSVTSTEVRDKVRDIRQLE
jgi:hypothetical protein